MYTRKTFPNCKTLTLADMPFSRSPAGHAWETPDKRHCMQTTIEPTLFVDFCLIPLSNTCSFVRPAMNVNREIFLHHQESFCVGKFSLVVDQAVLENRPLRKHRPDFVTKDRHCLKSSHWKLKMSMRKCFYFVTPKLRYNLGRGSKGIHHKGIWK